MDIQVTTGNIGWLQVTVLSIAALKKVSRGTRILLLDRNGGQSKAVAKELAKKGFKKVCSCFLSYTCSYFCHIKTPLLSKLWHLALVVVVWSAGICHQWWIQRLDFIKAADQILLIGEHHI